MEGAGTVRQIPSAGRITHRSNSASTSGSVDDNISLSSSYSGVFKRSPYAPRSSASDYSALRTTAGISRMRYARGRRKGTMFPNEQGGFSDALTPKGSHRMSIYSLGNLAEVGIKVRRRRRSTMDSYGRNRIAGETKYFDGMLTSVELFRRAVKLVQMFASLCQYKYEKDYEGENLAHTVFTQYINEQENQMEAELAFDASFFKANRRMRVSAEVKSILSLLPDQRTEAQLAKVLFSLRSIRSFAEYPQRIQQKLVKVGWFETHETKRAILRQGHIPQAFYFVLSGSAVVTVMEELETFARTVHFLRRGDSFGELAILHDTRRQSSVISRQPIELLVISKEDFVDIFMLAGGIKNLNDPDHQKFIKNVEFLKGWPIELMAVNPKKCLFHFFRSGSVLVKDSNHSDWIYIIKSGSCQVLKKLREVKSCLTQHSDRVVGFENVKSQVPKATSRDRLERVRAKLSVVTLLLPKLHLRQGLITHMSDSEDDSGNEIKNVDGLAIDKVAAAQKDRCFSEEKSPRIVDFRTTSPQNEVRKDVVIAPRLSTAFDSELAGKTLNYLSDVRRKLSSEPVPIIHGSKNKVSDEDLSVTYSELPSRLRKRMATDEGDKGLKKLSLPTVLEEESTKAATQGPRLSPLQAEPTMQGQRPTSDTSSGSRRLSSTTQGHTRRTNKARSKSTVLPPKAQDLADEEMSLPRHKISVIDEGEQRPTEIRITEADLHPMFVQVALLSKGDTFGVSSIVFDEQPSLSLVSNGAECIMISKKLYLSHCNDAMKRRLLVTETPYPNDDSLQKSLQDKVNWDAYRHKTMKSLIRELPTTSKRTKDLMVHRQTKRNMSLGADLKEAIRKIQVKEEDT